MYIFDFQRRPIIATGIIIKVDDFERTILF